jgi:hypothetical protein
VKYAYGLDQLYLRNPHIEEDALLVNVEYFSFPASMLFPPTRSTPACDVMLRSRFIPQPSWTHRAAWLPTT